jgi:hypothetical protein
VTGLAALLQWFWAGWDVYAGPGPSLGMRWLLTGTVGAAVLLPMGAAMVGAAVGRRLADPSLREQLRVTRSGVVRAALWASAWALAPLLLAAVLSAIGWTLVAFLDAGRSRFPSALAIWLAHTLVVAIGAAFAVWGLALSVGTLPRVPAALLVPPAAYCLLAAGPALVGPLLPHLARPERALDATLLVNPITAVAAALGMDLLRSPRVYSWTRAPEYWYVYPPAAAVAAVYIAAAGLGARQLRRRLESE